MNVAILVSGLPPERVGGAERQASWLARHLAAHHTVTLFTRTTAVPEHLQSIPRCTVVRRSHITMRGVRFAADIVATLQHLSRARHAIDVIVAYQTVIDGLIAVLAKRLFGIPVLVSVRCDTEYQLDRHLQSRLLSPFVFQVADRLAVQSATIADQLVSAFAAAARRPTEAELRAKLVVVPNGLEAVATRESEGDQIVYAGRLTKAKGVDVLIEAMRQCPRERLTIVGDGPERAAFERIARELPNIRFVGTAAHTEVGRYLAQAKMLVLPSYQEGQPNIVMEAMALGVPVIATRVGGVPDLITHGVTGWLTDPGNAGAIADAIRTLGADGPLRARLGANAAREMRQYDWRAVIDTVDRVLLELVGERAAGAL